MTKQITDLQNRYENICAEYIELFCQKHEIECDGWVGDQVGGLASFIQQYFFSLNDIVFDLNTNQPVGLILKWQDDGVEAHFKNPKSGSINFYSYSKGLRYEHLKAAK